MENVHLAPREEELSTQLYFALVLVMPEDSVGEMIVRNSATGEGADCWRKLQKEYSPNEAGNVLAMWTKLTDTKFDARDDVMVSISKLDEDMTRYQKMAGEAVSDLIKRGILTKALKDHDELQKHVFRNSARLNTYELLRAEVVSALTAERAVHDDPMEIGGLKGGKKGKGRGKGKEGKGKDKSSNPDATMECNYCHKIGHRSANCRKKIADERNKMSNNHAGGQDKKQFRKDKVKDKKRVAAAAVRELETLRQAGVATSTAATLPMQQFMGTASSADSAATQPVMRPVNCALRARMILALRVEGLKPETTGSTGSGPSPPTTSTSVARARSCSKAKDGITLSGIWTSARRAQSTAWTSTSTRSSTKCGCCESAAGTPALTAAVEPAPLEVGGLQEQVPEDDRLRLAPLRNAIMLDSGAQISAVPRKQVTKHNYTPTDSNVVGLKGIGGEEIERYGHVELNLSRGGEVIQVGAEVADVEYPVLATDAVVQRGQSVLHSPAGHWIINGTIEPPEGAEFVPLRRHQSNYYLEFDHIINGKTQPDASKVAAVRKTLPRKVPAEQEAGALPRVLGPEADETTTVPTRVLKSPYQPSAAERAAHEGHHLPFRPWCPLCVQARADDDPHYVQEPADEKQVPKVVFDIFYVGTDQLAAKYKLKGGYFSCREKPLVTKTDLDQAIAVLNVIDCKILAQATLFANKELDDYKVSFLIAVLEVWGHTTVVLQTDQEPATLALANAVRDRRSHSTLVRGSPPFSKQSAGYAEGANKLAAGLLRTYKLKLEHKLGREIKMTDPIVPWLVNSVGWMITRFQPRSHGGSSHKMLYGKEYSGEIAEMGEQVWYRISARVAAGRGKWEARFAKGIWVGKSELDDTHLVIDLERGVQKVRTVRRMPEEFRWQPELIQNIRVTPWKHIPDKSDGTFGRGMYITERMIDAHGPTDACRKCSTGYGSHSAACRQRFETIQADLLREKLEKDPVAPEVTVVVPIQAAGTPAPRTAAGPATASSSSEVAGAPAPAAGDVAMPPVPGEAAPALAVSPQAELQTAMQTEPGEIRSDFQRAAPGDPRAEVEVKKPRVASIGILSVCELAVCEEGYDETFDPSWDPHPNRSSRCSERCAKHSSRCQLRECHRGECACRRCLMSHIGTIRSHFGEPEEEQVEQMVEVSAELHEYDQWSPKTIHYDYYTGEPLDEDLYQQGRDDELQAMKDYGVYVEVATSTATDGKHIGGFPIAHQKEGRVRWRFVATEVNKYELREDNHQGTPPLMIVRATLSRAASSPTSTTGEHKRKIQVWDVRKAFFNADLDETIYVHPGRELCPPGRCWWLRKAMNGTRKASQMWGEMVRTTMDDGHWDCLTATPNLFYLPASPNIPAVDEDSTAICHGDDFLAEGYDEQLDELDELLRQQFEVTASARLGPGAPGQTNYLKRIIGYTDKLPGMEDPGFFWTADPKHVDFMIQWTQKRGCKPAPTPGTKATGQGRRDTLDLLSKERAREVAGAAGTALYLSSDRPDTMYASKTAMQHVSNPNVLMHARVQRLGRYYEGQPVLVWCYPLQGTPEGVRVDGDADWAPTSELQRRSTSGGAVRYGDHTWDCYSVTQSTIALSSGESEMYATGSATARGLQCKTYLIETQRPSNLKIYSDSTAGRGMVNRVGVGKVRHLELRYLWIQERLRLKAFELLKEDTNEMTADILTKYSEWSTIQKHCTTLNLMFKKQFKGLGAMAVFTGVVTSASGEKVTVYEEPGQVAVCPAPAPHYVDSEEFWFILKTGVFVVIAAAFIIGCACGCYAKNYLKKGLLQEAVSPAPGGTEAPTTTRTDMEVTTISGAGVGIVPRPAKQDGGARHKLLNTFLVVDLKQILRAKGLYVTGVKEDLIVRLIKKGNILYDSQAKEIEMLRVTATARGPLIRINLQDLSSPEAAAQWIETFKSQCRDRPDSSLLIHSGS